MSAAYWVTGNTLKVLRAMPDDCVDLVLTSPPFLALRSYLPEDDPAKAEEIGQEDTPGEFIDTMLDITEEMRRVLAPHGSIAVEFGDTYSGSGGAGGDYNEGGLRDGQEAFTGSARRTRKSPANTAHRLHEDGSLKTSAARRLLESKNTDMILPVTGGAGWPADKSLCLIPELYRFALAYGFNPLTGRETPRWRIRNVVRWVRPNPPVGALGDKFRPGTSEMVIATGTDEAGRTRYFDLDAVREPHKPHHGMNTGRSSKAGEDRYNPSLETGRTGYRDRIENPAGAPPLDWWEIPTHGYPGSHYATYPPALCERPIKAMCPTRVCTVCGEPSRRGARSYVDDDSGGTAGGRRDASEPESNDRGIHSRRMSVVPSDEWTDCGHDSYRNGRVLDIFGGSGTTLSVATGHGRDAIGIDLDKRNADLARERIGMFLTEVTVDELTELLACPYRGTT
jgi:DNA modification methylase